MSCEKIKALIDQAKQDGLITQSEVEAITSRDDPWFGSPQAIGTFFDYYEEKEINVLYQDLVESKIKGDREVIDNLKSFSKDSAYDQNAGVEYKLAWPLMAGNVLIGGVPSGDCNIL